MTFELDFKKAVHRIQEVEGNETISNCNGKTGLNVLTVITCFLK